MDEITIGTLLDALKHPSETTREQATQSLWQSWFGQKGDWGLTMLNQSQSAIESGDLDRAEIILSDLVRSQPDFAEAWNRRAVLHYVQENYAAALVDCNQTINLVPYHFGALHGLGLCHLALENYREAIQSFRRALEIQPYAMVNQKLILECTVHLS
ncbi:MAG: tetratricopeptide repeat protein [Cyanothece sp. SIO2G6]|nr:tetratricopeptide repeat protein [Cyanothece sp. SIO2G6]